MTPSRLVTTHCDSPAALAGDLCNALIRRCPELRPDPRHPSCVRARQPDGIPVRLELLPVMARVQPADAAEWFGDVRTGADLIDAWRRARTTKPFEESLGFTHVSGFADTFLEDLLEEARKSLDDQFAGRFADWLSRLDVYCAVKAMESLLCGPDSVVLFALAQERGWDIHFDHVAIRCGSAAGRHAENVVQLLTEFHGYTPATATGQAHYQFGRDWNAKPLFKVLDNGQVLRLFIDQSEAGNRRQIIQHWNHVYGFTPHHLALRATRPERGTRRAVPLATLLRDMNARGIATMAPTGGYTGGLLEQVFTRPTPVEAIPPQLLDRLSVIDPGLPGTIRNGKTIELVSRREMNPSMAQRLFQLWGIPARAEATGPSAPVYPYFLPAQAAHVIRTSIETRI